MFDLTALETPVVQAGMGFIAGHELAAAVSQAGGLGTISGAGLSIAAELEAARRLTDRPLAVNLLLPFAGPDDVRAAADADVVVTFWGEPRRLAAATWIHQCGSVAEAEAAVGAGADAVIAQGVEAGGHVRGDTPMLELLEEVRRLVTVPVLAAGGIVDRRGVQAALDAGAAAAVVGTRFLVSDESLAHPGYKQRCVAARDTIITELFGLGWPHAPHRVIPNPATADRLPGRKPEPRSPQPPTDDGPAELVDEGPLYAGAGVGAITDIRPAAELVRLLTP
jgi:NAD(P)H-dependent flavin oxidoreductase YrpB (nitropropane dioxygenase family)